LLVVILPWLNPYLYGLSRYISQSFISIATISLFALICSVSRVSAPGLKRYLFFIGFGLFWASELSSLGAVIQYFGTSAYAAPFVATALPGEAFANLRQRNQFATLTSIGLASLIYLVNAARNEVVWSFTARWAYPALVLIALGNAVSNSRTGLFQWLAILLITVWWWRPSAGHVRRLPVFVLHGVLAYAIAIAAMPRLLYWVTGVESGGLFGRLTGDLGCASRKVLWSNVLDLIAQKPWLGWGWGELDFAHFVALYEGPRFCDILDNAHNLPLHLAVELGVPVALAFCAALAWALAQLKPWSERDPARQMAWTVLLVIGLHSLVEYPLWYGPFQMAVVLCIWILWTTGAGRAAQQAQALRQHALEPSKKPLTQAIRPLFAMVMMAGVAVAGFDYWRVSQVYLPPEKRAAAYRDDTLNKVKKTWLFQNQARFAELSLTPLTADNAIAMHFLAVDMLHFSPEPRVIEKAIESAVMIGRDDLALFYLQRYQAAFPQEHAKWAQLQGKSVPLPPR
jgi:O-antigen ligase